MLVGRATDGDVSAFETLVRRHAPMMRAYTVRMLGSVSAADDVVQDSFLLAWRQLSTLHDPTAVRAWLMKIASRQALTRLRGRPAERALPERECAVPPESQPESVAIRNAQLRALSAALEAVSEDQRQCWLLREVAGLSYEQIAEELCISPSTARGKLARARANIYAQMKGWR
ncbi:RNA polymerase sigma factor [Cryobacterium psychrophilum]|uniref:RNA polymerase sigma factor n=2 Tax=Cryobacterium psychrophilum TaxID=41988 RepID=A0A4Y8KRK0_9MICO|nr:RNA polymerase sigma factor [Cryobacterium psychrophilum]